MDTADLTNETYNFIPGEAEKLIPCLNELPRSRLTGYLIQIQKQNTLK